MGTIKKIVNGVVTEVSDDQMVKTIENGVVVEKPFGQIRTPEKKNQFGNVSWNGVRESSPTKYPSQLKLQEGKAPSGQVDYQQESYSDGNTLGYKVSDTKETTPLKPNVPLGRAAVLGLSQVASSTLKSIGIAAKQLDFFNEYDDKKVEDLGTYKAGQWIEDTVKDLVGDLSPEEQDMFAVKLAQGVGNMGGFMLGGLGGKVLKMSPLLTTAALGSAVQASSEYEAAVESGATPEQASKVFWLNSIIGTTEAIPIAGAFRKLDKYSGGLATGALAKKLSSTVGGRIANETLQGFAQEAVQESTTQILSNTVAKNVYDVTRGIWDGVLESGVIGGITGSMMNAAVSTIRERRALGGLTKEEDSQLAAAQEFAEEKLAESIDPEKQEVTTPTTNSQKVKDIIKAKTDIESDLASNTTLPKEAQDAMKARVEELNQELEIAKTEVYQKELNDKKAVELESEIKQGEELLKDQNISEVTKGVIQKDVDTKKEQLSQIKPPEEVKTPEPQPQVKVDEDPRVKAMWEAVDKKSIKIVEYENPVTGVKKKERLQTVAANYKKAHEALSELINC